MGVTSQMDFDVAVIGAGLVGLACANRLARAGKRVLVLEQHARFGEETSSRNSGVIHAGLYYPTESLKAQTCVEGRRMLYERCVNLGIPHRKTGKLIVATEDSELERLDTIEAQARSNQAGEVRRLTANELVHMEPNVRALGALYSPESGIVDVHQLMYCHKVQASEAGATFSFQSRVLGLARAAPGWQIEVAEASGDSSTIGATVVLNAAGLHAERIAGLAGIDTSALGYRYHWCKGDYFSVASRHRGLVRRLIYPVPAGAGLGIHVTLDLAGQLMTGPDAEYTSDLEYDVRPDKREAFARSVQRYLPAITSADLQPGYAGIRPKLQGPGEPFRDFVLTELAPGLIALLGIESPGLTASEALAERVVLLVEELD
jgi:L-2-hydroxyglutarate oxidase LhgO